MMQSRNESEELTKDTPASPRMLRFPVRHEQHPHPTPALIVGTQEHAALVAAVKENFPEIYETN
jgi:hypothetical protein